MRQVHKFGEKCFVDYAGDKIPIIDQKTGEVRTAEIFVAILGASNYTYAEATWDQSLQNWTSSHSNALEYFGGVPELIIPDNLKTGINKACRYEPEINNSYHDCALHYEFAVMPTRVRKPKDKSKVENAVLVVQRWILAALRNRTFFSLSELNEAISELLEKLNNKPFKKLPGSRKSVFEEHEKSMLKPLPVERWEFTIWKKAKVNIDYHIEANGCYYSVPYNYLRETVDVKISSSVIKVFINNKYVCTHARSFRKGFATTIKEHMPKSHQEYSDWTPSRIISWTHSIGENCGRLAEKIISSKSHPALGYRSALGVIRLGKKNERLEKACKRAISYGGFSYKSVKSILEKNLENYSIEEPGENIPKNHQNIRGAEYFQGENSIKEMERELCLQLQ
jgi:transposase